MCVTKLTKVYLGPKWDPSNLSSTISLTLRPTRINSAIIFRRLGFMIRLHSNMVFSEILETWKFSLTNSLVRRVMS